MTITNAEHYPVHYHVNPVDPAGHLFEVRLTIAEPDPAGQVLSMPAWIPGSYMIRDFARNVVSLCAEASGGAVAVEKQDKQTWRCAPSVGPLEVVYTVYAWDLSVRGAHLDRTHGYFNGTSLFLRVHGRDGEPSGVTLAAPADPACTGWEVATNLPREDAAEWGFGGYRAEDYEALIDHPVEMGTFERVAFEACGVPHAVVVTGRHRGDTERLARDLKPLCEYHIRFFGEPPPFERYLFLLTVVGSGYGGLEHRASCSLLAEREDLPRPGVEKVEEGYRELLGLCSHEYFHTWNVKRILPAAFQPFDLSQEVHTSLLWAFEGLTVYYESLGLVRAGLIDRDGFLELLGRTITRVLRGPGRFRQSVAESSFDAWTRFYKQDENAPNAIVSYYAKGALVGLALDLTLRRESGGARSLDDVMHALWERHGATGDGVTPEDLEALVGEVAGRDMTAFFDTAVRGTGDLPLAELLAWTGVKLHMRPAESADDKGGTPPKGDGAGPERVVLGARTADDPLGARLQLVVAGGAAHRAGLAAGDVVVAVDGLRATHGSLERLLARYAPGERANLHAFRRDELMAFEAELDAAPADTCYLSLPDTPTPELEAWLS